MELSINSIDCCDFVAISNTRPSFHHRSPIAPMKEFHGPKRSGSARQGRPGGHAGYAARLVRQQRLHQLPLQLALFVTRPKLLLEPLTLASLQSLRFGRLKLSKL